MPDQPHKPTQAELQAQAEHKAEVNVEARHLLSSALASDNKAFQNELAAMPPQMQREVLAQARKLEQEREQGHANEKDFPRVEFWDSQKGLLPTVDVTAQGKHHDKVTTVFSQDDPLSARTPGEKAKDEAGQVVHGLGKFIRH